MKPEGHPANLEFGHNMEDWGVYKVFWQKNGRIEMELYDHNWKRKRLEDEGHLRRYYSHRQEIN